MVVLIIIIVCSLLAGGAFSLVQWVVMPWIAHNAAVEKLNDSEFYDAKSKIEDVLYFLDNKKIYNYADSCITFEEGLWQPAIDKICENEGKVIVNYDTDGGFSFLNVQTITDSSASVTNYAVRNDKESVGWISEDIKFSFSEKTAFVTLKAAYDYSDLNYNKIEYELPDDIDPQGLPNYYYSNRPQKIPNLNRNGYTFLGWKSIELEIFEPTYDLIINTSCKSNIILIPNWKANIYDITLNLNGGSCDKTLLHITYGEKYSLPIPKKEGMYFGGWEYDGKLIDNTGVWNIPYHAKLKALWFNQGLEGVALELHSDGYYISSFEGDNKNIVIPDYFNKYPIVGIKNGAFSNSSIQTVIFNSFIKNVPIKAFYNCKDLTTVYLSPSINTICEYSFYGCTSLNNITLYYGLEIIERSAFEGCTNLSEIILPKSVKQIHSLAFSECRRLETLYIPRSVNKVGEKVLFGKYQQLNIFFEEDQVNPNWSDNWNLSTPKSTRFNCESVIVDKSGLKFYKIKDQDGFVIYNIKNKNIKKLNVPSTINECDVTKISSEAFKDLQSLEIVSIENGIKNIESLAFYNCKLLKQVNLPDSLQFMGEEAFSGCESLETINIPSSIDKINDRVFKNCKSLQRVEFSNSLKSIGEEAFYNCVNLKKILIPYSVESIGKEAFKNCKLLYIHCEKPSKDEGWDQTWNYGASFTYFNSTGKTGLTDGFGWIQKYDDKTLKILNCYKSEDTILVPNKIEELDVTHLGKSLFYNTTTKIIIPSNIKEIDGSIFNDTNYNSATVFCETLSKPDKWNENWNKGNNKVFWNCLGTIGQDEQGIKWKLRANDQTLEIYDLVNDSITNIFIPQTIGEYKVTSIASINFNNCPNLKDIIISNSVIRIMDSALSNENINVYCELVNKPSEWHENWNGITSNVYWGTPFNGVTEEGLKWQLGYSDKLIEITGLNLDVTDISIPKSICGYNVAKIKELAFAENLNLSNIFIPNFITTIGGKLFEEDSNTILSVEVSEIPNSWSESWNENCYVVYNATDTHGVTTDGLNWVLNKDDNVTIAGASLDGTSIAIPNEIDKHLVKYINSNAFVKNTNLDEVFIPDCVQTIGENVFAYNENTIIYCQLDSKLDSWLDNWNNNNHVIFDYGGKKGVTKDGLFWTLSKKDQKIVIQKFDNSTLDSVVIPSTIEEVSVYKIVTDALKDNLNLLSITIPTSIEIIEDNAISGCTNAEIICNGLKQDLWAENWMADSPKIYWQTSNIGETNGFKWSKIYDVEGVRIEKCVDSSATNVIIPSDIEGIPVVHIVSYAFDENTNLEEVVIPECINTINDNVFNYIEKLTIYCYSYSKPDNWHENWNNSNNVFYDYGGQKGITEEGFDWILRNKSQKVEIRCLDSSAIGEVVIPSTIEGLPVYKINENAIKDNLNLTIITIPTTIEEIESNAISGCPNAEIVCNGLKQDLWADNWTTDSSKIYWQTSHIGEINGLKWSKIYDADGVRIEKCVDHNATNVIIPADIEGVPVVDIVSYAFDKNYNLEEVIIPSSVQTIGETVFAYNEKTIIYCQPDSKPDDWNSNWNNNNFVFYDFGGKKGVTLEGFDWILRNKNQNVEIRGLDNSASGEIKIPSEIEGYPVYKIKENAIKDNLNLTYIIIPTSITEIEANAIQGCANAEIVCNGFKQDLWADNWNSDNLKIYTDTEYVRETDGLKWSKKFNYSKITIEKLLDMSIADLEIPNNIDGIAVTEIQSYAFANCTSLVNVILPSKLKTINLNAFEGCTSLLTVYMFKDVDYVSSSAFKDCIDVRIFTEATSSEVKWEKDGILNGNGEVLFIAYSTRSIGIQDNFIWKLATSGNLYITSYVDENITSLNIPEEINNIKVDVIDSYAFEDCNKLTTVSLPNSVRYIYLNAFKGCTSLKHINMTSNIVKIGDRAFEGCEALKDIMIYNGLDEIGENAFAGCTSLFIYTQYTYAPSKWSKTWNSSNCPVFWRTLSYGSEANFDWRLDIYNHTIEIVKFNDCGETEILVPDTILDYKVTEIGDFAFYGNTNIKKVTLGSNMIALGQYAFFGCKSLTEINIPATVTTICEKVFGSCVNLHQVIIPKSVIDLRMRAFENCPLLTIYCQALEKPESWSTSWNYDNNEVIWGYSI